MHTLEVTFVAVDAAEHGSQRARGLKTWPCLASIRLHECTVRLYLPTQAYNTIKVLRPEVRQKEGITFRCPSFPCFSWNNGNENHQKNKDVFSLPNPQIPGQEGKTLEKTRKSSQGKKTRNSPPKRKGRNNLCFKFGPISCAT